MPTIKDTSIKLKAMVWDTSGYICLDPPRRRVSPTPEDQEVIRRNLERVLRWCKGHNCQDPMKVVHRWCGDYLHN